MDSVKDFIVDYIQREYTIPEDTDILNLNYVEEGYIDSMGLIQFIAVIEDEFNITFTDEDLIFLLMRTVSPQSPLYLMDSIALHKCKAKILNEINYNLFDFLKHSSSTTTIDSRNDVRRAFAYYIHIKAVRENDEYL